MASDSLTQLISSYHDFNPSVVDELQLVPSALTFSRYVARNTPFVIRQAARDWPAVGKWNGHYLRTKLQGKHVRVAVTPHGNADAVVQDELGRLHFVEPYEITEPFGDFLSYVQDDYSRSRKHHVKYAQPQNDSLRGEYSSLYPDVPTRIPFASDALEQEPDAINFWLGNDRSVTSLHKDNYENIYAQIRGDKHFVLLPPVEMPCVNETPVPLARYHPCSDDHPRLEVRGDSRSDLVPVPLWDPDEPNVRSTIYSQHSRPLKVTLHQGDMMYLPAMWYHKVTQGNCTEGFSCSVNYWYDMDFSGSFWTTNAFVRDVYNAHDAAVNYPELTNEDITEETRTAWTDQSFSEKTGHCDSNASLLQSGVQTSK